MASRLVVPYRIEDPESLVEAALLAHGWAVRSRKVWDPAEPLPSDVVSVRRCEWGSTRFTFLAIDGTDTAPGRSWWGTLSALLDGFVLGHEGGERRSEVVHTFVAAHGVVLEDAGLSHIVWEDTHAAIMATYPEDVDGCVTGPQYGWHLERVEPQPAPDRLRGSHGILTVPLEQFARIASTGLDGWHYRPTRRAGDLEAIDLWAPDGGDPERVRRWAEAADQIGGVWNVDEPGPWSWSSFFVIEDQGTTRNLDELLRGLQRITWGLGGMVGRLGGGGQGGWRSTLPP